MKKTWFERLWFYGLGVPATLAMWFFIWLGNIIFRSMSNWAAIQACVVLLIVTFTVAHIAERIIDRRAERRGYRL